MSSSMERRRWFALVLCLLIALLALHAKLSLYDHPCDTATVSSIKMWVDGQRAQSPALQSVPLQAWFPALLVCASALLLVKHPERKPAVEVPRISRFDVFQFERFLRPPPFLG